MIFQIYVGKRRNSRGKVELSLRFRCGKVDQQASTNVWVVPEWLGAETTVRQEINADIRSDAKADVRAEGGCELRSVITVRGGAADWGAWPECMSVEKERLQRMMDFVEECYFTVRGKGIGRGWLSEKIDVFNAGEQPRREAERTAVVGLIDDFMEVTASSDSSESRTTGYALMRRSVARFEEFRRLRVARFRLTVERLDENCLRAFESFMRREDMWVRKYPRLVSGRGCEGRTRAKSQNTVNDRMKLLKSVMRWAVRTGRIAKNPFDTYAGNQNVYGTPVYLTVEERRQVESADLRAYPRLERQRDMFVFQCCVGCRVSDLMRLTKDNIVDGELNYVARKSREGRPITIKVPLNRTAERVLRRYRDAPGGGLFPEVYTRVSYNSAIKEILRLAGVDRRVLVINPLTREAESRRLYEIGSSHMARRTFIGNIYKKFKDQNLVSELSGHAPGSHAFARYREIDTALKREMVEAIE
ncbi:MAG: site-specific integrase [Duncaniella sp.]|uniref:site-specific integrase n=1 Tax=Duncaniella sp. TaxID=2518496 RepID=UPI0023D76BD5|nr:site-specific integrase [Duncaniella sp.]MDE5988636.1 site-specific integrase [Duncaniella sp.]